MNPLSSNRNIQAHGALHAEEQEAEGANVISELADALLNRLDEESCSIESVLERVVEGDRSGTSNRVQSAASSVIIENKPFIYPEELSQLLNKPKETLTKKEQDLLDSKNLYSMRDSEARTVLHAVCQWEADDERKKILILQLLMKCPDPLTFLSKPDIHDCYAFDYISSEDQEEETVMEYVAESLYTLDKIPHEKKYCILNHLCHLKNKEFASLFIEYYPLCLFSTTGVTSTSRFVNTDELLPLELSAHLGKWDFVEAILKSYINQDTEKETYPFLVEDLCKISALRLPKKVGERLLTIGRKVSNTVDQNAEVDFLVTDDLNDKFRESHPEFRIFSYESKSYEHLHILLDFKLNSKWALEENEWKPGNEDIANSIWYNVDYPEFTDKYIEFLNSCSSEQVIGFLKGIIHVAAQFNLEWSDKIFDPLAKVYFSEEQRAKETEIAANYLFYCSDNVVEEVVIPAITKDLKEDWYSLYISFLGQSCLYKESYTEMFIERLALLNKLGLFDASFYRSSHPLQLLIDKSFSGSVQVMDWVLEHVPFVRESVATSIMSNQGNSFVPPFWYALFDQQSKINIGAVTQLALKNQPISLLKEKAKLLFKYTTNEQIAHVGESYRPELLLITFDSEFLEECKKRGIGFSKERCEQDLQFLAQIFFSNYPEHVIALFEGYLTLVEDKKCESSKDLFLEMLPQYWEKIVENQKYKHCRGFLEFVRKYQLEPLDKTYRKSFFNQLLINYLKMKDEKEKLEAEILSKGCNESNLSQKVNLFQQKTLLSIELEEIKENVEALTFELLQKDFLMNNSEAVQLATSLGIDALFKLTEKGRAFYPLLLVNLTNTPLIQIAHQALDGMLKKKGLPDTGEERDALLEGGGLPLIKKEGISVSIKFRPAAGEYFSFHSEMSGEKKEWESYRGVHSLASLYTYAEFIANQLEKEKVWVEFVQGSLGDLLLGDIPAAAVPEGGVNDIKIDYEDGYIHVAAHDVWNYSFSDSKKIPITTFEETESAVRLAVEEFRKKHEKKLKHYRELFEERGFKFSVNWSENVDARTYGLYQENLSQGIFFPSAGCVIISLQNIFRKHPISVDQYQGDLSELAKILDAKVTLMTKLKKWSGFAAEAKWKLHYFSLYDDLNMEVKNSICMRSILHEGHISGIILQDDLLIYNHLSRGSGNFHTLITGLDVDEELIKKISLVLKEECDNLSALSENFKPYIVDTSSVKIPKERAPVDLNDLFLYVPTGNKKELDDLRSVLIGILERKLHGYNPEGREEAYQEIEILLTHTYQLLKQKNDTEGLVDLTKTLIGLAGFCGTGFSNELRGLYGALAEEKTEVFDPFSKLFSQALLDLLNSIYACDKSNQTVHFRNYVLDVLKGKYRLPLPSDPNTTQSEQGDMKDLYTVEFKESAQFSEQSLLPLFKSLLIPTTIKCFFEHLAQLQIAERWEEHLTLVKTFMGKMESRLDKSSQEKIQLLKVERDKQVKGLVEERDKYRKSLDIFKNRSKAVRQYDRLMSYRVELTEVIDRLNREKVRNQESVERSDLATKAAKEEACEIVEDRIRKQILKFKTELKVLNKAIQTLSEKIVVKKYIEKIELLDETDHKIQGAKITFLFKKDDLMIDDYVKKGWLEGDPDTFYTLTLSGIVAWLKEQKVIGVISDEPPAAAGDPMPS